MKRYLHTNCYIRRHDYLVNLLQMFVEAMLFFNPAVWWISRQIRGEREACCDAMAVQRTGETIAYAQRSRIGWNQPGIVSATSMAAVAIEGDGPVLERIRRLPARIIAPNCMLRGVCSLVVCSSLRWLWFCWGVVLRPASFVHSILSPA
ncbi:MAG: M56 family metallopeptidase [Planctomycetota bacterium]